MASLPVDTDKYEVMEVIGTRQPLIHEASLTGNRAWCIRHNKESAEES